MGTARRIVCMSEGSCDKGVSDQQQEIPIRSTECFNGLPGNAAEERKVGYGSLSGLRKTTKHSQTQAQAQTHGGHKRRELS